MELLGRAFFSESLEKESPRLPTILREEKGGW